MEVEKWPPISHFHRWREEARKASRWWEQHACLEPGAAEEIWRTGSRWGGHGKTTKLMLEVFGFVCLKCNITLSYYLPMVNWWFGLVVWLFGIPLWRDCYLGTPWFESQTTRPQTTNLPLVDIRTLPYNTTQKLFVRFCRWWDYFVHFQETLGIPLYVIQTPRRLGDQLLVTSHGTTQKMAYKPQSSIFSL